MKIIYDNRQDRYIANLEGYENIIVLNTNDIVKAREYFLEHMTSLFNGAVCAQLKDETQ